MTLLQLTYIVAVDTFRHFVRAAEHCQVTQPTLSMQIRKLERELGIEIFDRSKQPVEPTDLGRRVIEQARVVLRETERVRELVAEADGKIVGELRIGILPTLAPYLLPLVVSNLARCHPGLVLEVEELRTDQIVEGIRTDRLDAGLVATEIGKPGIVEQPLFDEPFVGYVSERHRLWGEPWFEAEDLRLEDLWLLNEGHCFRDQVLQLCRERDRPSNRSRPLRFESGNLETLKRLVDSSGGLTLLPYLAVVHLTEAERTRVRPFAPPQPTRRIRLIRGNTYLKRRLIEALVAELLRAIPAELVIPARIGAGVGPGSDRNTISGVLARLPDRGP